MASSSSKAVAKLTITFGLVTIPVRLVSSADSESKTGFHQVHPADAGRIKQKRFCSLCNTEVPYAELGKGIETPEGTILITDELLETLPLPTTKEAEVLQFTDASSIPLTMFVKTYYVEPDGEGSGTRKAYALLRDALQESGRVGICKIALRSNSKESLAALRAEGDVLCLTTLHWPEEIRTSNVDVNGELSSAERKMAVSLVDAMTRPFEPEEYTNEYGMAFAALVESVTLGKTLPKPAVQPKPAPVMDMASLLEASIKAAGDKAKKAS